VATLVVVRQSAADWRDLSRLPFHLELRHLAASWLIQTVGWLLAVALWREIVTLVGGPAAPYRQHLVAHTWSGLGNIVPGSIWLPASRVALYRRYGIPALVVSAAVVVEWLVVGLGGVALYAGSLPFASVAPRAQSVSLAVAAVVAVGVLHPRVFAAGMRMATKRMATKGDDHSPAAAVTLGAAPTAALILGETAVLALAGGGFYFLMRAVAPVASLPDALNAWALSIAVANLLAWIPATVLFKDGAMVVALLPLYGSAPVAIGVVIAWRLWMTLVLLSWALLATVVARVTPVRPSASPS
jgi:hypothetical protein